MVQNVMLLGLLTCLSILRWCRENYKKYKQLEHISGNNDFQISIVGINYLQICNIVILNRFNMHFI